MEDCLVWAVGPPPPGMRPGLNGMWHAPCWGVGGCWSYFHGDVGRCKFLFQGAHDFFLEESAGAGVGGGHTFLLVPGHD